MDYSNLYIIIPSYNPSEKLIGLMQDLKKYFQNIIVINDGSKPDYDYIYKKAEENKCTILKNDSNLGKGQSIKDGIKEALNRNNKNLKGFITVDSDGQYSADDVKNVADELLNNPQSLVLGIRDFSKIKLSAKQKFRNSISTLLFKLSTGKKCKDTQTGLRGIPLNLLEMALDESGKRYEYEMNFLMDAMLAVDTKTVSVQTDSTGNDRASNYHVFSDTLRVFARFITYTFSSLSSYLLDVILFAVLNQHLIPRIITNDVACVWISSSIGKIAAAVLNYIINKKLSFKSKAPGTVEFLKYLIVFLIKLTGSGVFVNLLKSYIPIPITLLRCIVDTLIFFVCYRLQKVWVFKKTAKETV